MAMSYVIRKTSPTVVPLALRAISISSARVVLPESSSFRSHQFSTASVDQKLDKLLKSELKSMGRRKVHLRNSLIKLTGRNMPPANAITPADFPFKIEDRAGFITLTRELPGEKIEVFVDLPRVTGTEDDDPSLVSVPLQVKIFKKDGTLMKIHVLGCADEIIVERINIRVPGGGGDADGPCFAVQYADGKCFSVHDAGFKELARDVQYSFKEFIGVRGIKKTNVEFLLTKVFLKYVVEVRFLEALKKFVNESASSS